MAAFTAARAGTGIVGMQHAVLCLCYSSGYCSRKYQSDGCEQFPLQMGLVYQKCHTRGRVSLPRIAMAVARCTTTAQARSGSGRLLAWVTGVRYARHAVRDK